MVNKENKKCGKRRKGKRKGNRVKKKKRSKAQQILKRKTLNHEIHNIDLKEFSLDVYITLPVIYRVIIRGRVLKT